MARGLIVGKFYPPHAGHHHMIRSARAQVDELVIAVCDRPPQDPAAGLRATWLREVHPDCDVRVIHDIGHDDDSAVWADYTRSFLPGAPDVVFTSEDYGDEYARQLGCRHICVDRHRIAVPLSATLVRADPAAHWHHLEPAVRAGLTRRVVITGAASSGTTTLARALAERLATVWVPEYGRQYSVTVHSEGQPWSTEEFVDIALAQQRIEDEMARSSGPVLICDTDALATAVWHDRYIGRTSPDVDAIAARRTYAAYVLTGCEIPFEDDGVRDHPELREPMTERFRTELARRPEPWIEVTGDVETRVTAVLRFLRQVLGDGWLPPTLRV